MWSLLSSGTKTFDKALGIACLIGGFSSGGSLGADRAGPLASGELAMAFAYYRPKENYEPRPKGWGPGGGKNVEKADSRGWGVDGCLFCFLFHISTRVPPYSFFQG